ncbi:hypothetical protein B0H13DRAFT_1902796 [Mycena leptocephala]|nr:hypothetical protein B0H13DRAFT_1902796 [Mycena leptocephala]
MSFHVLSTLLSASAKQFPDTHFILVGESLGLCDPSRTRLLQHLNQLRKVVLADYVYIYPTKDLFTDLDVLPQGTLITQTPAHGLTADTLIAPGLVDDPATRLQIYIMRQIAPALTSRALRRLLDMHGVKYAATDKSSADVDITSLGSACVARRQELKCLRAEWPQVVPDHLKRKPVHNFNLEISAANLATFACGSCNELCPVTDKKTLSFEDFDLDLLRRPDHIVSQALIQERNLGSTLDTPKHLCPWEIPHLKANKVPPLSTANNNYLGPSKVLDTEKLLVLGSPKAEILGKKFCGQGKSLVNFLDADRGHKPGIILTERTWAHNNTVMVNTSAYTEMKETGNGEDDDRDVWGPMLGARIGDLMWSRSEIKGCDVYNWVYWLKANITERIYDKSDLLYF